jgi:conjugative transposon TraN protein
MVSLSVFSTMASYSQSTGELPATTTIIHYKLSVGYYTTTVLIFPSPIQQADRGAKELMAQKQPGVENVLKVKAARKDFPPTNLHVFTADDKVYAFDVVYASDPTKTTYDLTTLIPADSAQGNSKTQIEYSKKPFDRQKLASDIAKVKAAQPFFSTRICKNKIEAQLQKIYQSDNVLYFEFKIANESGLPYNIDFTRLYIQDRQKLKRSSIQQREVIPIYNDTVSNIPGKSVVQWVIAVPQLTIPDHRQLFWEMIEKNGGRYISLEVTNRKLLKAKSF